MKQMGEVIGAMPILSEAEDKAEMREKSREFLAEGGRLYVASPE